MATLATWASEALIFQKISQDPKPLLGLRGERSNRGIENSSKNRRVQLLLADLCKWHTQRGHRACRQPRQISKINRRAKDIKGSQPDRSVDAPDSFCAFVSTHGRQNVGSDTGPDRETESGLFRPNGRRVEDDFLGGPWRMMHLLRVRAAR